MIIGVNFIDQRSGDFGTREYNYNCILKDVKVGDYVVAPSANGDAVVRVCSIDVPEGKIDERIFPKLKTITEYATETEDEEV